MAASKLPHRKNISTYVVAKVKAGVSIKDIVAGIQKYQEAPRSVKGLYSTYGDDIAQARNSITEQIGNRIVDQALAGDFKSQELYLRSKGGWSPTQTIQEQEIGNEIEEDTSAVDQLMTLLGKTSSTDEGEE